MNTTVLASKHDVLRGGLNAQGWPRPKGCINIKKGQEVIVSTDSGMAHDNVLPIEFSGFDKMCAEGDTLFVGRYLTNGADVSSVYMDVSCCLSKAIQPEALSHKPSV